MDTSETYIKMCEKAREIQACWQFEDGDFYTKVNSPVIGGMTVVVAMCDSCNVKDSYGDTYINESNSNSYIWLPRQDQLQEMAHTKLICNFPCQILMGLDNWRSEQKIHLSCFGSMEQLWLAYVMFDNYNKVWNGEDWV